MIEGKLRYEDLGIGLGDICLQMGYGERTPDDDTLAEIQVVAEHVRRLLVPRYCFIFRHGSLNLDNDTLTITDDDTPATDVVLNIGRIITRQIKGSEAYALFVCTSGAEFEAFRQQLNTRGDMVKTFIADALGSVIAEKTADCMEATLRQRLATPPGNGTTKIGTAATDTTYVGTSPATTKIGTTATDTTSVGTSPATVWHHTNRFSPGYCGWHVSEQHKLFSLFPAPEPCGVRLTPSALMMPIKSVSGIIGLGSHVRRMDYTCGLCDYLQCYKRKLKVKS